MAALVIFDPVRAAEFAFVVARLICSDCPTSCKFLCTHFSSKLENANFIATASWGSHFPPCCEFLEKPASWISILEYCPLIRLSTKQDPRSPRVASFQRRF